MDGILSTIKRDINEGSFGRIGKVEGGASWAQPSLRPVASLLYPGPWVLVFARHTVGSRWVLDLVVLLFCSQELLKHHENDCVPIVDVVEVAVQFWFS